MAFDARSANVMDHCNFKSLSRDTAAKNGSQAFDLIYVSFAKSQMFIPKPSRNTKATF